MGSDRGLAAQLWDRVDPWANRLYQLTLDAHAALKRLSVLCPLALVSNTAPAARRWLQRNRLERYFGAILLSCEVGISKPDEGIFREALDAVICRPEDAVMIGDRLDADIAPALRLGLWTLRVRQGPSYWQTPQHEGERAHLTVPSLYAAALTIERRSARR
jgi:HAD superfamily hydrolase (TIGR01549 family)